MTTPQPSVYERKATSLSDFIASVEQARKYLIDATPPCEPKEFWYRGHGHGTYKLTPSLFRYANGRQKEELLFSLFSERLEAAGRRARSPWQALFHMQHYGIPTRLLDWTSKLYYAVFYALTANPPEPDHPILWVLNPLRLNRHSGLDDFMRVPSESLGNALGDLFSPKNRPHPMRPMAIMPTELNERMRSQYSRFTAHATDPAPLERQCPDSVARIVLQPSVRSELAALLDGAGINAFSLFPDHEGVARFVFAGADLHRSPYDPSTADSILVRLRTRTETARRELLNTHEQSSGKEPEHIKGAGRCNIGDAYIHRSTEAGEMAQWLANSRPFLFITGEAGIGKTNFVLHCLFQHEQLQRMPFIFVSFKYYGSMEVDGKLRGVDHELEDHVCNKMLDDFAETDRDVALGMIRNGAVIVVLDGLDELARIKSQRAVEAIARQLDRLVGDSQTARIIISCRDHIYQRLNGVGALGSDDKHDRIDLNRFRESTMRSALERQLGTDAGGLAAIAITPLFYEMIRQAGHHVNRLVEVSKSANRTELQEEWFKVMLAETGYGEATLLTLGKIAGQMLKNRSDLIDITTVGHDSHLIEHLSGLPFALFTHAATNMYSFSHQSLREFVLAWCVAQEVKRKSFDLLIASASFDYEGAEFYKNLNGLLNIKEDVVQKLDELLHSGTLGEAEWNNLARNLFEMLGHLVPYEPAVAEQIIEVALIYIDPQYHSRSSRHYIKYKTRYNIVRCLERIHPSAPQPYFSHVIDYDWSEQRLDRDHLAAYAVRGFHMEAPTPAPLPPMVFDDKNYSVNLSSLLVDRVSDTLLRAIEQLNRIEELPTDGDFFALNCTFALIRWLPAVPDLNRILTLLKNRHMSQLMKRNTVYAFFRRYSRNIPEELCKCPSLEGVWRNHAVPMMTYDVDLLCLYDLFV